MAFVKFYGLNNYLKNIRFLALYLWRSFVISVIVIAHNLVPHDRTKHVEIDKHFIKEKLENGLIVMPYIPTVEQVANILTKRLPKKQFDDLVSKLAMNDIFKPAWGGVLRISTKSKKFWFSCYLIFRDILLLFRDRLLYILNLEILFCS